MDVLARRTMRLWTLDTRVILMWVWLPVPRQAEDDLRAATIAIRCFSVSSLRTRNGPNDREAEATPPFVSRAGRVGATEPFERVR
jgi:hypothetical protein